MFTLQKGFESTTFTRFADGRVIVQRRNKGAQIVAEFIFTAAEWSAASWQMDDEMLALDGRDGELGPNGTIELAAAADVAAARKADAARALADATAAAAADRAQRDATAAREAAEQQALADAAAAALEAARIAALTPPPVITPPPPPPDPVPPVIPPDPLAPVVPPDPIVPPITTPGV